MSKRKKSYDRVEFSPNYYNRIGEPQYNYPYNPFNFQIPQDTYNKMNFNNMLDVLNNIDMNNLNNIFSLLSNGVDINNNLNNEYTQNTFKGIKNKNEVVINFFNSLKPILGDEFYEIIDRFIEFYMEEINREK